MYFLCSRFWFLRVCFAQFAFKVINLFLCTSMNHTVRVYIYVLKKCLIIQKAAAVLA
jgi:hypothetical protein